MKHLNNYIIEKFKINSKNIKKKINSKGISEDTYRNGVYQIEEILENCINDCGDEYSGIHSFITDILANVSNYDLFYSLKEYFKDEKLNNYKKKKENNKGISEDTYRDGVYQIEEILENCINDCGDEDNGINSFITDILYNIDNDTLIEELIYYFQNEYK